MKSRIQWNSRTITYEWIT